MPQKYERSMPLRKRQQQKFETKHSGILKKICYNFRKKHDRPRTKYKTKDKNSLNIFSLKT